MHGFRSRMMSPWSRMVLLEPKHWWNYTGRRYQGHQRSVLSAKQHHRRSFRATSALSRQRARVRPVRELAFVRYAKPKVSGSREFANRFGPEKRPNFSGRLQRLFTKFAKTFARLHRIYEDWERQRLVPAGPFRRDIRLWEGGRLGRRRHKPAFHRTAPGVRLP